MNEVWDELVDGGGYAAFDLAPVDRASHHPPQTRAFVCSMRYIR
jgi:hypothetical protein